MMKIGRYRLAHIGPVFWIQTKVPVRVRHFLWFWFVREARLDDIDKKKQFPMGTPMEYEGRQYRYWKAGKDIVCKRVDEEE